MDLKDVCSGVGELLEDIADNRLLASALIVVNLVGVGFGISYYWQQILRTSARLLPFVPDSPVAVLAFALFLLFYTLWDYQSPTLNLFTTVALTKTGVWSVLVIGTFWPGFFSVNPSFSLLLVLLHLGMVLQAWMVVSVWEGTLRKGPALLVLAWFLAGDWIDYVVGTVSYPVPFIAGAPYLGFLAAESVLVSIFSVYWLWEKFS